MKAFDFYFDRGKWVHPFERNTGGRKRDRIARPEREPEGWIGGAGPGIDPGRWPLDPRNGRRLLHALTLRLPDDYWRRGPELPGIAFFYGEPEFNATPTTASALVAGTRLVRFTDILGTPFALLWLTDEELTPDPEGEPVWLEVRADPNAGIAPVEYPGSEEYEDPTDPADPDGIALKPWAERLVAHCHLGGTAFPEQGMPELSPYYLEIGELVSLNFGTGSARIDLELNTMEWAC